MSKIKFNIRSTFSVARACFFRKTIQSLTEFVTNIHAVFPRQRVIWNFWWYFRIFIYLFIPRYLAKPPKMFLRNAGWETLI